MRLKKYGTCVKTLEGQGLNRRQIAKLIGIDEAVISRRMSGKQKPTVEALIVVNLLSDIFAVEGVYLNLKGTMDDKGWFADSMVKANDLAEVGASA